MRILVIGRRLAASLALALAAHAQMPVAPTKPDPNTVYINFPSDHVPCTMAKPAGFVMSKQTATFSIKGPGFTSQVTADSYFQVVTDNKGVQSFAIYVSFPLPRQIACPTFTFKP